MTSDLYDLFDIETADPSRGAAFTDLAAIREMFDSRNREAGSMALQVPTDDQLKLINEDAQISLQDSGLPADLWNGVSGAYYLPAPRVGPFHGWKLSLFYSDDDGWKIDRIANGGGSSPTFRGFILQLTDNRIHTLERAGLPTHHFSRQIEHRITDGDGNVIYRLGWTLPEAGRSYN